MPPPEEHAASSTVFPFSTALYLGTAAFVAGAVGGLFLPIEGLPVALGSIALALFLLLLAIGFRRWLLVSGALFFIGLGWAHHRAQTDAAAINQLSQLLSTSPRVELFGTVASLPESSHGGQRFILELYAVGVEREVVPQAGRILCRVRGLAPHHLSLGDQVRLSGSPQPVRPPSNPGEFDYARFLLRHGIAHQLQVDPDALTVETSSTWNIAGWALRLRDWARLQLTRGLEEEPLITAVLAGMVLGYKEDLPLEWQDRFRDTGTFHIFAVSGQNVGVLLGVGIVLMLLLGLPRWHHAWLLLPILGFYALMTGLQPSVVRAFWMAAAVLFVWKMRLPLVPLVLWTIVLAGVVAWDPRNLLDVGFQLSFSVVWALIVIAPRLFAFSKPLWSPDAFIPPKLIPASMRLRVSCWRLVALLSVSSIAAWLGSAPLLWWHFHQFCYVGLFSNLLVVPLASVIVVVGSLTLLLSPLSFALNQLNALVVSLMLGITYFFSQWPGASLAVPDVQTLPDLGTPRITVLATESYPVVALHEGWNHWLINTGDTEAVRRVVAPYLRFQGVNTLSAVLLANEEAAALSGARDLGTHVSVQHWMTPPVHKRARTLRNLVENLVPRPQPCNGNEPMRWGGFTVTVLDGGDALASRGADRSLVLSIEHGPFQVLYAGRIGFGREQQLRRGVGGDRLRAQVLLQGPNPEEPNITAEWLEAIGPPSLWIVPRRPPFVRRVFVDGTSLLPQSQRPLKLSQDETGALMLRFQGDVLEVRSFRPLHEGCSTWNIPRRVELQVPASPKP